MNIDKLANSKVGLALAIGVIGAGFLYYTGKKAAETVSEAAQALNPINNDNIFASGVDAVGAKLSGNEHWSLGGWIYDITHKGG